MKRVLLVLALASLAVPAHARTRVVRHPGQPCSYSLVPAGWNAVQVPAAGITRAAVWIYGQTAVCAQWNAYSSVDWVTIEAAPMDAQPAAYVTVAQNVAPEPRTTTLLIAGIRLEVTQEGAPAITNPSLVSNGTFDANIDGWIWYDGRFPNGLGTASWSALDANGSPLSGSILMHDNTASRGFQRLQCIPVNKNTDYRFGAKVRTGASQTRGEAAIAFFTYGSPDCSGDFTAGTTKILSPAEPNVWQEYAFTYKTGSRTQSVIIVIASAAAIPPFDTWFDDVFVELASAQSPLPARAAVRGARGEG